jgi:uncharacterized protein (DUF427 family)
MVFPEAFVEPTPRRVRVKLGEQQVAESSRALLVSWYGHDRLPTYAIPESDVRTDLLVPTRGASVLFPHATAFDVEATGARVEHGAYRFVALPESLARANGHWSFTWDDGLTWFEEALEVHVHARDPRKRVDVLPSDRHVVVELDGVVLADTRAPHALFETTLPTRWYLPPDDVRLDLFVESDTVTRCPYKGTARYWSVTIGERVYADIAWSYPEPVVECPRIAGLISFFNERVDLTVDGERVERPTTPWSESSTNA